MLACETVHAIHQECGVHEWRQKGHIKALSRVYGENVDVCGMSGRSVPTTWILRMYRSHLSSQCFATCQVLSRLRFDRRPRLWFAGIPNYLSLGL